MKKIRLITIPLAVLICLMSIFVLVSCDKDTSAENPSGTQLESSENQSAEADAGVWKDAKYLTDTELGTGAKTILLEVKADGRSVTFTIHTDEKKLDKALLEHKLVEGEDGEFGLYVKKVNGILADYDTDQTYWGYYKNGEMQMTGISGAEVIDGDHYELVREK